MKKKIQRTLVYLLTLALLLPMISTIALPVMAAITAGTLNNMDKDLIEGLIAPSETTTINTANAGGLRFATNINLEKYAAFKQFCKQRRVKGITLGTLIAPLDYVQQAGAFSPERLSELPYKTPYLDVKANNEIFYDGDVAADVGYDEQFVASVMNIKLENRNRDFAAIGYIQLTLITGDSFTVYSYDNEDMALVEKYATNLAETAAGELQKDTWGEDERAMIADLAAEPQRIAVGNTAVTDFRYTRSQAYFTYVNSEGQTFYNRITYNGANGWRLQTNAKGYNHFQDIGAGQSLAMYMGEGFHDVEVPLQIAYTDDLPTSAIRILVQGEKTSVHLSCNTFDLDFCNNEYGSLYNVNGMSLTREGNITLTGRMNETEAVYGGGERFDDANKRGKRMSLYISDSYDAKGYNGSYVAIPLFSTSRGGGMFINRYEMMTVSFPEQNVVGDWSLTIDNDIADCYFYATGEISDVLQAYTDMTGHASLPAEWAQGYLVCRYAPDFNSLGGLTGESDGVIWFYNIEDIPNYQNFTYTPHQPLTQTAVETLDNNATVQSKDGKITYYTYVHDKASEDKDGNGKFGEKYFRSEDGSGKCYYSYSQLPNKELLYYDNQTKIPLDPATAELCHKKTVSTSAVNAYHYIIESETEDFNYNGITGETYFMRISTKGGPGGAGVDYVIESLIGAGMKPTGVVLEGLGWYEAGTRASQWSNVKKFVTRLDELGLKTLLYISLGHNIGDAMAKGYKENYSVHANIYKYSEAEGKQEKITTTISIPKSDKTDNPDTTSDGTQTYIDITNPEAMEWYFDKVWETMVELGVDGVKIDFCESVPNEGVYKGMKINKVTYDAVYLEYDWYDPTLFGSDEAHHVYPSYLVSAFYKAMNEKTAKREGDEEFIVLTRGGGIGAQRNPYLWAGDQSRRFRNLKTQLAAVINSGISGVPFVTYDMGGYAYYGTSYHYYGGQLALIDEEDLGKFYLGDQKAAEEYESEIFVRALQFTAFGNMIQTHGDVRHLYQMTEEAQQIAALYSTLHEELADYLQELSQVACDTGMPMIRHMILEYQNDANVADIDDQFMYGDALLLAPILTCNTTTDERGRTVLDYASVITREVYLPAGEWIDLNTGETIVSEGMTITVDANLAKIPVYLNTASEYAEQLQEIFNGETWSAIKVLANAE